MSLSVLPWSEVLSDFQVSQNQHSKNLIYCQLCGCNIFENNSGQLSKKKEIGSHVQMCFCLMQGRLLCRATTSVNERIISTLEREREKGGCLGRKQESVLESGVWSFIL